MTNRGERRETWLSDLREIRAQMLVVGIAALLIWHVVYFRDHPGDLKWLRRLFPW